MGPARYCLLLRSAFVLPVASSMPDTKYFNDLISRAVDDEVRCPGDDQFAGASDVSLSPNVWIFGQMLGRLPQSFGGP